MDRQPRRESFFLVLSALMFLVVLGGFSRTLYLRPFTDVQDMTGRGIPSHLIVHGLVMTAWFALVVAQTWLVRSRQVATHRRFGLFGAALGCAVIATGLYTLAKFAPRAASTQFDPARAADILVGNTLNILLSFQHCLEPASGFEISRRCTSGSCCSPRCRFRCRWDLATPICWP